MRVFDAIFSIPLVIGGGACVASHFFDENGLYGYMIGAFTTCFYLIGHAIVARKIK